MPTTKKTRARKRPEKPAATRRCAEATGSAPVIIASTDKVKGLETWVPENGSTLILCERQTGPYVALSDYERLASAIRGALHDDAKYPQLRLPDFQRRRLESALSPNNRGQPRPGVG